VSCIYGLGDPECVLRYAAFSRAWGAHRARNAAAKARRVAYERSDVNFQRGTFSGARRRCRSVPSYQDQAFRIELWGEEVDSISTIDPLLGEVIQKHTARVPIYPKSHYVMSKPTIRRALKSIKEELEWWEPKLIQEGQTA